MAKQFRATVHIDFTERDLRGMAAGVCALFGGDEDELVQQFEENLEDLILGTLNNENGINLGKYTVARIQTNEKTDG